MKAMRTDHYFASQNTSTIQLFNQCTQSHLHVFQISGSFFVPTHFSLHSDLSALSSFHYYSNVTPLSRSLTSCSNQKWPAQWTLTTTCTLVQHLLANNTCHCIPDLRNLEREYSHTCDEGNLHCWTLWMALEADIFSRLFIIIIIWARRGDQPLLPCTMEAVSYLTWDGSRLITSPPQLHPQAPAFLPSFDVLLPSWWPWTVRHRAAPHRSWSSSPGC